MKKLCKVCGGPIVGRRSDAKFCSNACDQRDRRRRLRENAPPPPTRKCAICGTDFIGRPNKKFCSQKCAANKSRGSGGIASSTSADGELIAYLLSDAIHSGNIAGELERLRAKKNSAVAALEARLRFELGNNPTWPHGALARCAVALVLLDRPNVVVGRWRRGHEVRRAHRLQSGLSIKAGF